MELNKLEKYISKPIETKAWRFTGIDDCVISIYRHIFLLKTGDWIVLYGNKTAKTMTDSEFQATFEKAEK